MDSHSKKGTIFIAQVDHLSGECIGQTIDLFYNRGASNVQVIPTITKKNRPSYIFFIDCREQYIDAIEETIFKELNTGGLHRIETIHKYLRNEFIKLNININFKEKLFGFLLEGKKIGDGYANPESDNVVELKNKIYSEFKQTLSYNEVYSLAKNIFIIFNNNFLKYNDFYIELKNSISNTGKILNINI